jgi:ASC-1-like (ASCH) protein
MKHEMHLDPVPFDEIYSGLKKIELRLNDEKRQKIHVRDSIKFYRRPEDKIEMEVHVVGLHKYDTIKELVQATPIELFGPRFKNQQQLFNAFWHYTKEEIEKYGLLVIKIERT